MLVASAADVSREVLTREGGAVGDKVGGSTLEDDSATMLKRRGL